MTNRSLPVHPGTRRLIHLSEESRSCPSRSFGIPDEWQGDTALIAARQGGGRSNLLLEGSDHTGACRYAELRLLDLLLERCRSRIAQRG